MSFYVQLQGLGGFTPAGTNGCKSKNGCTTSTDFPEGLSRPPTNGAPRAWLPASPDLDEDLRLLCNESASPIECYYAKGYGTTLLGRGTKQDVELWQRWTPAPDSKEATKNGASDNDADAPNVASNVWLYVAIGTALVASGGALWYLRMR